MIKSVLAKKYGLTPYEAIYVSAFGLQEVLETKGKEDALSCVITTDEFEQRMKEALAVLAPRRRRVLLDLASGRTISEISREENVTDGRIRQIEGDALRDLRCLSRSKPVKLPAGLMEFRNDPILDKLAGTLKEATSCESAEAALKLLELLAEMDDTDKLALVVFLLNGPAGAEEMTPDTLRLVDSVDGKLRQALARQLLQKIHKDAAFWAKAPQSLVTTREREKRVKSGKDIWIEDLDFSPRIFNCLRRMDVYTLEELLAKSEKDLKDARNLGAKSLKEIKSKLAERGLTLAK